MTKLWQKGYRLDEQVERFEGAQNSALDTSLIRHEVWGSLAHAAMLKHIGILKDAEYQALKDALAASWNWSRSRHLPFHRPMRMYIPASRTTW